MDKNQQLKLVLNHCSSFNLKKIKVDTLLLVVHMLLSKYEQIDPSDKRKDILNINNEDCEFINKNLAELKNYLEKNIVTLNTMMHIYQNQNSSNMFKKIAKNIEPMRDYYQYFTKLFSNKIQKDSHFIPELLAITLLNSYKKEFDQSFMQHNFLDSFQIERILDIYNKSNLLVKKDISSKTKTTFWEVKTNLDEMYDLSEFLISKYINYSYKINTNRNSKIRTKKKK